MRHVLLLSLAFVAAASPLAAAWPFRVVVHPATDVRTLETPELSALLLKETTRWPDGTAVEPVDQSADSAVREELSQVVHGREVGSVRAYWQRQVYAGRNVPPPEVEGDAAVLAMVRATPGAIGYVSSSAPLDGVRAVEVVRPPQVVSRAEPEYPPLARRARQGGKVVVAVDVGADGRIVDARIAEGLPYGLSEAALEAVRAWAFAPALVDGEPAAWTVKIAVSFRP